MTAAEISGVDPTAGHPPISQEPPGRRRRAVATLLSVVVHALLLMFLIYFAVAPKPLDINVVPVQLVTAVPQPQNTPKSAHRPPPRQQDKAKPQKQEKKPQPQPKQAQTPPPPKPEPNDRPHGRLASDDMGNPDAPLDSKTPTDTPPAGEAQPQTGSEQPHDTGDAKLAMAQMPPPKPEVLGDKSEKPKSMTSPLAKKGGARVAMKIMRPNMAEGRHAKVFGPDASFDEYLGYLKSLFIQQRAYLSAAAVGGRHGWAQLTIVVMPSGHIAFVTVARSSGYPDIDRRIVDMVNRMGELPVVPERLLSAEEPTLQLTLSLPYPMPD